MGGRPPPPPSPPASYAYERSCKVIDDMDGELQQQMADASNEQVYEDSVKSVEDVVSNLNSPETFPDLN